MSFILMWLVTIFFINLIIFMIRRPKNKNKDYVYIEAFCVYNSRVYWLKEEKLFSSDYSDGEIDILSGEPVDHFNDLMPVESIEIIKHLQERIKK